MFLENKYSKWYYNIINNPNQTGYTEKHHIIPKCMGGSNLASNIVSLSARQHFICHLLLTKMAILPLHRGKLNYAVKRMLNQRSRDGQRYLPKSSRIFTMCRSAHKGIPKSEECRRKISLSKTGKKLGPPSAQARINMSKAQKGKPVSLETRAKLSASLRGKETAFKGRKHTTDSLLKMSESQKARVRKPAPKHSSIAIENNRQAQLKYIYTLKSPLNIIYQIDNIKQFCQDNGLSLAAFNAGFKNIGKTFKDSLHLRNKNMIDWTYLSRDRK